MTKNIIITGASRGIGYETALQLANEGHTVIATARSTDKLQDLAGAADRGNIIPVAADLTTKKGISAISEEAAKLSQIHGLINNAGAVLRKPLMDTEISEWKHIMDINVYAAVRMVQAVVPFMVKGSHIVNISSMSGFQGSAKFPGLSAYGAAKAALIGLSEVLSLELGEQKISVNCLCFGAVQTEMLEEAFPGFEAPVQASEMGGYLADFIQTGHRFYNGKVLPVALNNPE